MPYVTADRSLPRSLDVQISLSRPQAESRTDLSIMCCACESLGFLPNANRVRFYSTIEAVENDFAVGTEAQRMASAFFSQSPRAVTMAIGEVFLDPQPAYIASASVTDADAVLLTAVEDGTMDLVYNPDGLTPTTVELASMDFSGMTLLTEIVDEINTAIGEAPLTCAIKTLPGGSTVLTITTDATGDDVTIQYPTSPGSGTFVGDTLKLTDAEGGSLLPGWTPTTLGDEMSSIANAAAASDKYLYGWALGASLRDAALQTEAAEWILARTGIACLVTNDVNALDPTYTTDIGSVVSAAGNRRVVAIYHDNVSRYPDVSILAYMLHVNYQLQDSTVTAKFKVLPGIETVQLTETEWGYLQAKGYNTYTAIGNDARTYRDGGSGEVGWFMDTVINLDNFVEDLSVNVFNVFLRNKKVPYTRKGQLLLLDAMRDTGSQYEYNGTFAPRDQADSTVKAGYITIPAVQINPTPIQNMTAAQRTARTGPPSTITVQEAGAIHSTAISVEVVS